MAVLLEKNHTRLCTLSPRTCGGKVILILIIYYIVSAAFPASLRGKINQTRIRFLIRKSHFLSDAFFGCGSK
jgi:hypothetical protein